MIQSEEDVTATTYYISTKLWKRVREIIFFHISMYFSA